MRALWLLSWRIWPASVLVCVGLAMVAIGPWLHRDDIRRPVTDHRKGHALLRGLRWVLSGLALAGFGLAWIWQLHSLALVAVVIGIEELWEASLVLRALAEGERRGAFNARAG